MASDPSHPPAPDRSGPEGPVVDPPDSDATRPRLVLASASPARLATLRRAGIDAAVEVSGVDEEGVRAPSPAALAQRLAELKADAVARRRSVDHREVVVGCDSVLERDGVAYGKPSSADDAAQRWREMRGRTGVLHTGHALVCVPGWQHRSAVASTVVHFAEVAEEEIAAYVATGEPLAVAGAFTLDGLGGAFVTSIEGDPHTVVGISLPLLRTMLAEMGVRWIDLWRLTPPPPP